MIYLTRDDWGADPAHPRLGQIVEPQRRRLIWFHHTVMVNRDDTPNVWEGIEEVKANMRRLQTIRPDLGLDVPYNFVCYITQNPKGIGEVYDLVVCEGRGLFRSGAHTPGRDGQGERNNVSGIGIAFAGNFEAGGESALRAPENGEVELRDWLYGLGQYGFTTFIGRHFRPHRAVKATLCPGKHLIQWLGLEGGKETS